MLYVNTIMSHSVTVRHPDGSDLKISLNLHVDGAPINVSRETISRIVVTLGYIGTENKIEAIKIARAWFKIGLLEAKLLVEQARD